MPDVLLSPFQKRGKEKRLSQRHYKVNNMVFVNLLYGVFGLDDDRSVNL